MRFDIYDGDDFVSRVGSYWQPCMTWEEQLDEIRRLPATSDCPDSEKL